MKATLCLTLTLLTFVMLIFVPNSFAQDSRPIVRLIYFYPRDRAPQPNIDQKIDKLIKDTQEFYAQQMEIHGFDRKTFLFETDAQGKAVVHHVKGRFNHAYYRKNWQEAWDESHKQFDKQKDAINFTMLDVSLWGEACGRGGGDGRTGEVFVNDDCFTLSTIAHELGHAFGLHHDYRRIGDWVPALGVDDPMTTSFCAAEWLDGIPAFNTHPTPINTDTTLEMLAPSLVSPPNTIRLRFKVTDPDGLLQVQWFTPELWGWWLEWIDRFPALWDYKGLRGTSSSTVEFVTTVVKPNDREVILAAIDVHGNITRQVFPIDVSRLLPSPKVVSIPDANLAAAVRQEIGSLTTHTMLNLTRLEVRNRGITDLTGLEHAHNLNGLSLVDNNISDLSPLATLIQLRYLSLSGNDISDVSPLATLTQLRDLHLAANNISDVSPLAILTQLETLGLSGNNISDVSPLATLTQLRTLHLNANNISDVSPLATLTQLRTLHLNANNISDVSPLATLTQLRTLSLWKNDISDVSPFATLTQLRALDHFYGYNINLSKNPLSYASIHKHIPAMQAKGIEVTFDNIAYPVLLKISGDSQEGTAGEVLTKPFVVEARDKRGKPLQGASLTFAITDGSGSLSATTPTTNAAGRARSRLTLGEKTGKHTVRVTSPRIPSSVTFTANATGPPIYWIAKNRRTLHRSKGIHVENLVPSVQNATSLAVDVPDGKFYWTEQTSNRTGSMRRANLDGSEVQLIKDLTSVPRGIAIDTANSKLYLTNSWGKVQRLNVDGSNFEPNLITGLASPKNIVLDIPRSKLYWIEQTDNNTGKVQRADLDGSNVQVVKSLTSVPLGLAIDPVNRKLYLTNAFGKIQRLNLDGSNFEPNFIVGLDAPEGIAVDIAAGKLYWAETDGIRCADLSGENVQEVVTGLGTPSDLALHISSTGVSAAPVNVALASQQVVSPEQTHLFSNYPNPFNPETWIPYQLSKPAEVTLHIYAVNGTLVRTLALGHQLAGMYHSKSRAAYWDGRNAVGEPVASGVYFYTLTAGDFTATRKMLIRK